MSKFNQKFKGAQPQQVAAWVQERTLWESKKPLTVLFLNTCEVPGILGNTIITEIEGVWSRRGNKYCFKDGRGDPNSNIRVKFEGE